MDRIEVSCENGHRLKASRTLRGTSRACPRCGTKVEIPLQRFAQVRDPLSDTDVMRILGVQDPLPAPPPRAAMPETRSCPRCQMGISTNANVCNHCQCYVGVLPDFLQRMCFGSKVKTA